MTISTKDTVEQQRVRSIATMILTRIDHAIIIEPVAGVIDYFVEVSKNELVEESKYLGIVMKVASTDQTFLDKNWKVRASITSKLLSETSEIRIPTALLVVQIATGAGRFGWLLKPDRRKLSSLIPQREIRTLPATRATLNQAASEAEQWHKLNPVAYR